jgi:lysophospholipid acyltransferase (LPLAT)-like uncharacterized protein
MIGAYGERVVRRERVVLEGGERIPAGPCIWVSWHGDHLTTLAFHRLQRPGPCLALVPPGLAGASMAGWLERAGVQSVELLPEDGSGNLQGALHPVARGLSTDQDAVIAVDGPTGPAHHVRPGALWLARLTGCPLLPAAVAARPALHMPRWDQHLVPLPGSRIAVAIGVPIYVAREATVDDALAAWIGRVLDGLTQRASALLDEARQV